jgi:hypothetical protein
MVLRNVRPWATGAALCMGLGLPLGAWAQDLADMHCKLAGACGLKRRLFVSDKEDVNAYATEQKGVSAGLC